MLDFHVMYAPGVIYTAPGLVIAGITYAPSGDYHPCYNATSRGYHRRYNATSRDYHRVTTQRPGVITGVTTQHPGVITPGYKHAAPDGADCRDLRPLPRQSQW